MAKIPLLRMLFLLSFAFYDDFLRSMALLLMGMVAPASWLGRNWVSNKKREENASSSGECHKNGFFGIIGVVTPLKILMSG